MAQFTHDQIDKMFPAHEGDRCFSYDPLVEALGESVVQVSSDDYQGITRILLKERVGGRYCLYDYEWGSCSGCDFAQGCSTVEEFLEYANDAAESIQWKSVQEILSELFEMEKGNSTFGHRDEEQYDFVKKCREYLNRI